jgi:hypothetical protein
VEFRDSKVTAFVVPFFDHFIVFYNDSSALSNHFIGMKLDDAPEPVSGMLNRHGRY